MPVNTLLVTPLFTQLNTTYPATAYLKGFLSSQGIPVTQMDLSIELFSAVFTSEFIDIVFKQADQYQHYEYPLVRKQRKQYIARVDSVMDYLRHQEEKSALQIIKEDFLPHGHRRQQLNKNLSKEFKALSTLDQAKHLATLFVEELGDFIHANVDEFFSFTRYAESIARAASSFDTLKEYLDYETSIIEDEMCYLLDEQLQKNSYSLVAFTVPFPGNLFAALRCAQFIKKEYPEIKIALGGGYCSTELRRLSDPRIFNYVDFICLDGGEIPLLRITEYLAGIIDMNKLERTYFLLDNEVVYTNYLPNTSIRQSELPAPDYTGLPHQKYLSFLDVLNPMHRLWSDGRWNKLTLAHGCYWSQCSFCDVHLDYIAHYESSPAEVLVDKIERIIADTSCKDFHFVDEAAPPNLLRALALELLKRKLQIRWWTNVRFEKTFTPELCMLLAQSGCIAVSGGLEVASDRLLEKMNKGVDIAQVARVTKAFTEAGIMVHAYLMFGFPTQTAQETIDSLEVVRQLFQNGCIHSAFWHQFACTAHSPVGKNPEAFNIQVTGPNFEGFAENDLYHKDPQGSQHHKYSKGLKRALQHYLNNKGFEIPLQKYFGFKVPTTTHAPDLIAKYTRDIR